MKIAFKRILGDFPFMLLLLCIVAVPLLAYKAGEDIKAPPFGFVCEDSSDDGGRICEELISAGFARCANEDELREKLMDAKIDCGIIIPSDISDRLSGGDLNECIKLITSPETLMSELCRVEVISVISLVYSPYVTYESLKEIFDIEEVKGAYYGMLDSGVLFDFDIKTVDGKAFKDTARSVNLFRGSLSILIFITIFIATLRPAKKHFDDMKKRLGSLRSFTGVLLPELLLRVLFVMLFSLASSLAVSQCSSAVIIYILICTAAGLILTMLLNETSMIVITVFVSIFSLGLCPVFTDLALIYPLIGKIRMLLLPYLMWLL